MAAMRRSSVSPPPLKRRRIIENSITAEQPGDRAALVVYSWNVNGIEPFVQQQAKITSFFKASSKPVAPDSGVGAATFSLRDKLRRYGWPALLFLQEVKMNPDDVATRRALERALVPAEHEPQDHPSYRAFFCLPHHPYNARGLGRKVYGVCTIVRADFYDEYVERIREVEWDSEGRLLICETKGCCGLLPKLAFINIYAVNGTEAPYKDDTGRVVGTRHDRKLQVHAALQEECRRLEFEGFGVILAGDLNIARSQLDGFPNLRTQPKQHCMNRADFEKRFLESPEEDSRGERPASLVRNDSLRMIDSFVSSGFRSTVCEGDDRNTRKLIIWQRYLHPRLAKYTYYPRGRPFGSSCDRVDMILLSRKLEANLIHAGMRDTPEDRGPSDHIPLFCALR